MSDPYTPRPEAVSPYLTQRRRYKPKEGETMTIHLPGELIRAKVKSVVNDDAVVCVIIGTPIAKTQHGFAKDDMVCVRRDESSVGVEAWVVQSDRELEQQKQVAQFAASERARDDEAERARIADIREADLAAQAEAEVAAKLAKTPWYKRAQQGTH